MAYERVTPTYKNQPSSRPFPASDLSSPYPRMTLPSDPLKYYPAVCAYVFQRASYLRVCPPCHPFVMALLNFTSFTMKMGAADSSNSLIIIYQIIPRHIPEYFTISLVITAKKNQNFQDSACQLFRYSLLPFVLLPATLQRKY